ncbi:toprim domain-containing protein [Spirosoma sordidisoli]|uniref:Toprim domain-containing protein n=1 Tax=Spirosoma sordidisoli TaxID=2502893 RepID=A0A4Q2UGH8_9BACT|nr:toprim domain-containing protein [Spirosoma sordidisoli]RYC66515.1 hypothetical protein EQG79_29530 [Spirosoma sordidisoli]
MQPTHSLDDYRREIDLVVFLEQEGFRVKTTKGSRHSKWVTMEQPDTDRHLIVSRKQNGEYRYYNPSDDFDKGTVIDFVAGKKHYDLSTKKGWREVADYLNDYLGRPTHQQHTVHQQPTEEVKRSRAVAQYFRMEPLTDTRYLESRGIRPETLSSFPFSQRIFNQTYTSEDNKFSTTNTVFPLENGNGMLGLVVRNDSFNQIRGSKDDGVWVSNVDPTRLPKELFICESPIDALSYHELHPPAQPHERVYVSLAGTPSYAQPLTVQRLISRLRPERILLGNDNDPSGIYYNTMWLAQLNPARSPVGVGPIGRVMASERKCTVIFDGLATATPQTDAFTRYWQQGVTILNRGYEPDQQRASLEVVGGGPSDLTQLRLEMPKQRPFLIRLEKMLLDFRGLTQVVEIKRPAEKDWNEQLQQYQKQTQALANKPTEKPQQTAQTPGSPNEETRRTFPRH